MGMSDAYGPADRNEILKTLEAAAVAGINLIDTGDFYGKGRNELLIGEALKTLERETLLISVKFGAIRSPNGQWLGLDMRPKSVKNYL
jgi:aryl-alcohol dehydrogenase-like predicted oxidoreductase